MKCIMNREDGYVERVTDEVAAIQVKEREFFYCPKEEWKKQRALFAQIDNTRSEGMYR